MSILTKINELIQTRNIVELKKVLVENKLKVENNKIVPEDPTEFKYFETFWDQRQQARKILLNDISI